MSTFIITDDDRQQLLDAFVAEADDVLDELEQSLLKLEERPDDEQLLHEIFRGVHTLKGNAACLQFEHLTHFAHAAEELLDAMREGRVDADAARISQLLIVVDAFRDIAARSIAGGGELTDAQQALHAQLTEWTGTTDVRPEAGSREAQSEASLRAARGGRMLRIGIDKLDRMLDLAGEIAIARGRVRQLLTMRGEALDVDALVEVDGQIEQLHVALQELVVDARMVPIGPTFRQYARTVRDLAAATGKSAQLVTTGDDVELDTSAVEMLRDPLTHMVRNAIDHGLETSDERIRLGKPAVGRISLAAAHEAGSIVIRMSDDGAGLDRSAIARRAAELGFDPRTLTDAEIYRLIFEPGFSTAASVTDLSGRGVGMDVVRRAVEALRGSISIETSHGHGTTFTIRLPLTLAMIDGFGVSVDDETFVVPMDHVEECLELPAGETAEAASGVLLLRDEVVPYVRLRHHFALGGAARGRENVLVVRYDGLRAGLVVDALHGASPAVIKPLGSYFREVPGVAGSSILGNGRVALILDTPTILRNLTDVSAMQARSAS